MKTIHSPTARTAIALTIAAGLAIGAGLGHAAPAATVPATVPVSTPSTACSTTRRALTAYAGGVMRTHYETAIVPTGCYAVRIMLNGANALNGRSFDAACKPVRAVGETAPAVSATFRVHPGDHITLETAPATLHVARDAACGGQPELVADSVGPATVAINGHVVAGIAGGAAAGQKPVSYRPRVARGAIDPLLQREGDSAAGSSTAMAVALIRFAPRT
jgi:hypothetical protein